MSKIKEIQIYASTCTRVDYYLDSVKEVAKSLDLDCRVEKIIDEEQINQRGFCNDCGGAYCPGCKALQEYRDEAVQYLPVLVINGQIVIHSHIASREEIEEAICRFEQTP